MSLSEERNSARTPTMSLVGHNQCTKSKTNASESSIRTHEVFRIYATQYASKIYVLQVKYTLYVYL